MAKEAVSIVSSTASISYDVLCFRFSRNFCLSRLLLRLRLRGLSRDTDVPRDLVLPLVFELPRDFDLPRERDLPLDLDLPHDFDLDLSLRECFFNLSLSLSRSLSRSLSLERDRR